MLWLLNFEPIRRRLKSAAEEHPNIIIIFFWIDINHGAFMGKISLKRGGDRILAFSLFLMGMDS